MEENELHFSVFFSLKNAMNSLSEHAVLSEHAALSEFIKIYLIYAFPNELAKRAYRAKRVHLVRMKTYPPVEIPM